LIVVSKKPSELVIKPILFRTEVAVRGVLRGGLLGLRPTSGPAKPVDFRSQQVLRPPPPHYYGKN